MSEPEVFDLQRLYTEKAGQPLVFTWEDRQWTLPSARMLDISVQEKLESFDPTNANAGTVDELFSALMGAEQGEQWAQCTSRPLGMILDLFAEWQRRNEAAMGESEASSSSSGSTGRRSSRTSSGSTASGSAKPSTRKPRKTATPPVSS